MKCPKCQSENPSDSSFCGKCGTQIRPVAEDAAVRLTETLRTPPKELATGSTFAGRYQVIEELGKGGMGRVYKVHDADIKDKVALKLIRPEIASDKDTIERFSNEMKYARKISHPNVCRMYDLGRAEGTYFITMEYVPGEDLKTMLRMSAGLTLGTILSVGKQVCEGLAEAHRLAVVHRDLKPQNIMIDKDGHAKIMDFGIARSTREKGITGPSVLVGTPEYMSPEQAEAKEVDQRSDLYSLGVILYEMATGRVPFEGETALSIAMKHKGESPKEPREVNPGIPDDLNAVILKCLEKDKTKRYQGAAEVGAELGRIEKGLPSTERVAATRKPFTSKEITVKLSLKRILIPAAVLIAAAAVGIVLLLGGRGPSVDPNRIAVAVFENKTGDPKYENVGYMAADWITQGLMHANLASVSPVPTAEAHQDVMEERDRLRMIAKRTGAGKILTGTYYLQGETMRFHAQVQDARAGKIIRSVDPVSGPADDPVKLIESLGQRAMGVLAIIFAKNWWEGYKGHIPSYEAYNAYVEGEKVFKRYEYPKAIEYFERSIKADPDFIAPLSMGFFAYYNLGKYPEAEAVYRRISGLQDKMTPWDKTVFESFGAYLKGDNEGIYRSIRRLRELDPRTSPYLLALSAARINRHREAVNLLNAADPEDPWVKDWMPHWDVLTFSYHMLGEYKKELKAARRARRQYPDKLEALWLEIRPLAALGRIEDVNRLLEEGRVLPPDPNMDLSDLLHGTGRELRTHGLIEESRAFFERTIDWLKNRPEKEAQTASFRGMLANSLYWSEKWEEAQAMYEVLSKEQPENLFYYSLLGNIAARRGDREKARRIMEELGKIDRPYLFGYHTYCRALIASLLGEKELAVNLIRESIAQGQPFGRFNSQMALEPLQDYPPFRELMKPKG